MTSLDNDKEDLGDIVRDDTMKSVHLGEDASAQRNKYAHFSIDWFVSNSQKILKLFILQSIVIFVYSIWIAHKWP